MTSQKKFTISTVVSYAYPYIGSGIGNVAQKQSELLADRGHEVYLLSSNYPRSDKVFTKNKVTHIKFPALFFLEKFHVPVPLTLLSFTSLRKLAESDIVHVHDALYLSSFVAAVFAKLLGKKLVVTVHINHIHYTNPIINLLEIVAEYIIAKPVFIMADRIIVINDKLKKELLAYRHKIKLISNGVDTNLFRSIPLEARNKLKRKNGLDVNKKNVLFVGRLVPKKGYHFLLQANSDKYDLFFVGNGEVTSEMKKIKNTHWIGAQNQDKLIEYYQMGDVLVLPSQGEGYPLSIKEAIACGLPVITTFQHPSLSKLKNRMVFHVEQNTNQIKGTILTVLNKSLRNKFTKERNNYLAEFSWQKNISDLENVYNGFYE